MIKIYDSHGISEECEAIVEYPNGSKQYVNFILYNGEWLIEGEYEDLRPDDWEELKEKNDTTNKRN